MIRQLFKYSVQGEHSSLLSNGRSSSGTYSRHLPNNSSTTENNFAPHTYVRGIIVSCYTDCSFWDTVWGRGTPLPPCPFTHLLPFYFSLSFIGFTYFLLLSIPSLSTRIVPLRFQAGGRRKRSNLALVCCVCVICIP